MPKVSGRAWALVALGLVAGAASLGAGAALWARSYLRTPAGGAAQTTLDVSRGATLRPVLDELARRQVLRHPSALYLLARWRHRTKVGVGRYEVSAEHSPAAILQMLNEGRVLMEDVTLAEGLNRWQVRKILVQAAWMTEAEFDGLCDDTAFLARHQVAGPSCEGYLFPDTYKFARGQSAASILERMFSAFKRQFHQVTAASGFGPLSLGEREFTTLAAIVEKETAAVGERARIACVFYNRLRARPPWKLQTDPTVIYAATLADKHFDGNLTRRHLHQLDSPYNTYRVEGLPPGPIANPGRAALAAVAQPALCKDYFFVSNNKGEHIFCPTLQCHAQAVDTWQVEYFRRRKARAAPAKPRHHHPRHPHHERP